MSAARLDKLIATAAVELEAAELSPVPADMVQLEQEQLSGRRVLAYYFCGTMLWWPAELDEDGPLPDGATPLYVRAQ